MPDVGYSAWVDFAFSGVSLTSGTQYAIVAYSNCTNGEYQWPISSDSYADGAGWYEHGSGWYGVSGDMTFKTFMGAQAYYASGDLVSSKYDTGQASDFGTISFTINESANTDIKFQIRTAASEGGLDSATWYGPAGAGDYYQTSGASINSAHNGDQWVQYKAYFSTTDTSKTPRLDDITITYEAVPVEPSIEINAPGSITGWTLTPVGDQPNVSDTGTLHVTTTNADGHSWYVTASDEVADTSGYLTKYGTGYDTGTKLGNPMQVHGPAGTVTLPGGGQVVTGSGTVTDAQYEITFRQTVLWTDEVLPEGYSYRIIITFTATIS